MSSIRRKVKCKSGLRGFQCRLQKNYNSFEEFETYSGIYNLVQRLKFQTAKQAWQENPMIQGSTIPTDFCVVKK
ncbi:MAG TPA: hypothetical protein VF411_05735 [Bacteroidia bacterium]